jgi:hypothetical protein
MLSNLRYGGLKENNFEKNLANNFATNVVNNFEKQDFQTPIGAKFPVVQF